MKKTYIGALVAGAIPIGEFLFFKNNASNTPAQRIEGGLEPLINNPNITPYVGNFPESFAIPAVSGFIGDFIEYQGNIHDSNLLRKIGEKFPEITATAITTYFILGETVLPSILPGTADARDIPAVIVSALAGYTLAKIGRNSDFIKGLYNTFSNDSAVQTTEI